MRFWFVALALLASLSDALGRKPGGDDSEYFDAFMNGKKEWRLVFRGTANIGKSVYKAYKNEMTEDVEPGCKGIDFNAPCANHYRNNDALDHFKNVEEVAFGIVKDGTIVKAIMFSGKGHNYMSWFSEDNYDDHYTCYHDLRRLETNFFSIRGHGGNHDRRFFINRIYGGCPKDEGWFVAIDGDQRNCNWEKDPEKFPIFKYSPRPMFVKWDSQDVDKADGIAIFIKYRKVVGNINEYADVYDSGVEEWRLAFRGTAGAGTPFYKGFKHGVGIPKNVEEGCKSTDWSLPCKSHYRNNEVFKNWHNIKEIMIGVIADGEMVKTITFDAAGSKPHNWFHKNRLLDSCWTDLSKSINTNIFSMQGHAYRRFFINNRYGGCPRDVGWLTAIDDANNIRKQPCTWSRSASTPKLMYSAGLTRANWNDAGAIKEADAFVMLVKYNEKK